MSAAAAAGGRRSVAGLTAAARARFRRDGYLFPLPALDRGEAAALLSGLEAFEAKAEGRAVLRHKGHVVLPWLAELIRHPRIIAAVSDLLGPDLLCWTTNAFIKDPGDGRFVSWHQDATYWGLSAEDVVTAWVALTRSAPENGCMRVIPGSHRWPQQPHRDTHDPENLLTRGQEIAVEVDERRAIDIVLEPGEMSLHHALIPHASGPNRATGRRIGIAIRYVPTWVRQTSGYPDSATLVAGVDRYGHFRLEPRPARDGDPEAWAFYREILADSTRLLLRPTPPDGALPTGPGERRRTSPATRRSGGQQQRKKPDDPPNSGGANREAN